MNDENAKYLKQLAKKHNDKMLFVPIGGISEIGMNAYLYHYQNQWILIDAGMGFADYRMPGIDSLLPDFRFLENFPLSAILITHGHEDHIGAITELLKYNIAPIYTSNLTKEMLQNKLRNFPNLEINLISHDQEFKIGDLEIMPCMVSHSIPEAFAFFFKTKFGVVVHSGDWKYDEAPVIGKSFTLKDWNLENTKIKAMICDSTNITVAGKSGSESSVGKSLEELIKAAAGNRIFITCFASNVARLSNILHAANNTGRKVLLLGRAMHRMYEIGMKMGYFEGLPEVISEDDFEKFNKAELMIMLTGSQGEGRSMLAKISRGENKQIKFGKGDQVMFSSRTIPGNEISIAEMQNQIVQQGAEIVDVENSEIHVSGHYQRAEIDETYLDLRPEWVIPVHGEPRHRKAHCNIADDMQLKSLYLEANGSIAIIGEDDVFAAEKAITLEMQMAELNGRIIAKDDKEFTDKKKIIWNGAVIVSLAIDKKNQTLQTYPQIVSVALTIDDKTRQNLEDDLADIYEENQHEGMKLEKNIDSLRHHMRKKMRILYGKRPVIEINLLRV